MSHPVTIQEQLNNDRLTKAGHGVALVPPGLRLAVQNFAQMSPTDPVHSDAKIELMLLVEREFNWLPRGTVVAVNYQDGTFISGNDRITVMKRCAAEFGQSAGGQLFEVGQPVGVGGWRR
jgi:hypothetical protein